MKNLFDFATKELSQDAFICWLVSNYDNEENIELKKLAYDFISFITKKEYKIGDIKHLKTLQQANNMDIIIDIWEEEQSNYKKYTSDYVIVIEDKTTSSAHTNQLIDYGEIVRSWKKEHSLVFYKTNVLSDTDKTELDKDKGWKSYDINSIYNFFKNKKVNDEIVNFYIEHVDRIYQDINSINKNAENWNFFNYNCFINKVIKPKYVAVFKGGIYDYSYQGKYVSTGFYFKTNHESNGWNNNVCLEIFFRPEKDTITATIHPEFKYKDGTYSWKLLDKEEYKEENMSNERYRWILYDLIKYSDSKYFKTLNSKQCVGTSKKDIDRFKEYEFIIKGFEEMIDDFINIFKDKI